MTCAAQNPSSPASGLARLGVPAERIRDEFSGPADEREEEPRRAA